VGAPLKLSSTELQVVRAALMLAVHGDDSAWASLSSEDEDIAQDLLDLIPEPMTRDTDEDEESDDDIEDEDY